MRKVQEYSETIKCDCCGAELAKVYRSRFGFKKTIEYQRFNSFTEIRGRGWSANYEYHLCPWCEIRLLKQIKKEKEAAV
jgi:ssDNA-binding Zn-finger/Zn-ribbon topoisomerase 1